MGIALSHENLPVSAARMSSPHSLFACSMSSTAMMSALAIVLVSISLFIQELFPAALM